MKLMDVTEEKQNIFFRCLQDEMPEDPGAIAIRRSWYERNIENGHRAKDGSVGSVNTYPLNILILLEKICWRFSVSGSTDTTMV